MAIELNSEHAALEALADALSGHMPESDFEIGVLAEKVFFTNAKDVKFGGETRGYRALKVLAAGDRAGFIEQALRTGCVVRRARLHDPLKYVRPDRRVLRVIERPKKGT